ncbi:MAG: hypothetical protein LUG18_05695 [Candidatus Azobacteroides sp.]|nr:hypothetical protein [Candidatus Azobacteroides sp.]
MQLIIEKENTQTMKGYTSIHIKPEVIIFKGLLNEVYNIISTKINKENINYYCKNEKGHDSFIILIKESKEIYIFLMDDTGYKLF